MRATFTQFTCDRCGQMDMYEHSANGPNWGEKWSNYWPSQIAPAIHQNYPFSNAPHVVCDECLTPDERHDLTHIRLGHGEGDVPDFLLDPINGEPPF